MSDRHTIGPAKTTPCSACPWRTANHGNRHPGGWYTKANRRRLWAGMRRGEAMTCHPTDPANPVPEGWPCPPADTVTRECAGFQILVMREMSLIERMVKSIPARLVFAQYRRIRPRGLTRQGMEATIARQFLSGTPLSHHHYPFTQPTSLHHPVSVDEGVLPWPVSVLEIEWNDGK
jgi:hypothetical protein